MNFNLNAWQKKHGRDHRAEFAALVQRGETMHSPVRQWTPEQIAALNAERPMPPKPVKVQPKKSGRFVPRDDSTRARMIAVIGDGALTVADIRAALPDVIDSTIRSQLSGAVERGELVRVGRGRYQNATTAPRDAPAWVENNLSARILAVLGDAAMTVKQVRAALTGANDLSVRAQLKRSTLRGDLVRIERGLYRKAVRP